MKLSIRKQELNEAIQHVSKAITHRTNIAILTGIKMDAEPEGVKLTASDTEISIQSFIPMTEDDKDIIRLEQSGSIVLPSKIFIDMIRKLPEEYVHIEVKDQFHIEIRSGSSELEMTGMDPEEYPLLPHLEEHQVFAVPAGLLKEMIRQTSFAVSTQESTPILTGILWNLEQQNFKFVATDRHRLASRQAVVETAEDLQFSNIVLPGKTLNELNKIMPDSELPIHIVVADNQVLFRIDKVLFYTRILDGTYPDTSKIIPQTFKTEIVVDRLQLQDTMDRAFLLTREEKANIVKVETLEDGRLEITSTMAEMGKMTEHVQPEQLTGEPLKISFNSKYMLDVLKVTDCDQIHIGFTGAMSPIVVRPSDSSRSLHLILPYRTTQ